MTEVQEFQGAMTRQEFQRRAGHCGATTFYKEVAAGRLVPIKQGRRTMVTHTEANRWLAALPKWDRSKATA